MSILDLTVGQMLRDAVTVFALLTAGLGLLILIGCFVGTLKRDSEND